MNSSCVSPLRLAVVVLGGMLLAACEATNFRSETTATEAAVPVKTMETQGAALQATSSYLDLRLRTGALLAQGSTCYGANEVSSLCGNSGGAPDSSFMWTAPYSGNFSFTTESSTYDTVIQIAQWGNGVSLGCNDNNAGTPQSAVSIYLAKDSIIRITVDGANGGCGQFQLNVTGQPASCGSVYCNAPPSTCTESYGTCQNGACAYPSLPAGFACNDGNACTSSDTCNGYGTCTGNSFSCNSPPSQCYEAAGTCNGSGCNYAPKAHGTACSDGNSCTSGDYCNGSGSCVSGNNTCCSVGYTACNGMCCRNRYEICNGYECEPINNCNYSSATGSGDENIEYCP